MRICRIEVGDSVKSNTKTLFHLKKAKKVFRFIIAILMYSICLIMLLIFLVFIINFIDEKRNLSKGITKPSLFSAYTIVSPSMVPNIKVLDVVVIKRIERPEDIQKGDVITFNSTDYRYSGVTVTHRVKNIEKTNEGKYLFTTKGDANNTIDASRVDFNGIYGKVMLTIPKIGYIQYFLSNIIGWTIIVIFPAACVIAYDIVKLVRTIRKDPKNKKQKKEEEKEQQKQRKQNQQQKKLPKEKKKTWIKKNDKDERRRFE